MPSTMGLPLRATTSSSGILHVKHDQAVGALDVAQHAADRVLQAGVGVVGDLGGDHVRERLGVGVADQRDATLREAVPELLGVLDDAVVHDRDAARGVGVRVGVDVVRLAVGGPPGVADADGGLGPVVDQVPQVLDPARGLGDLQPVAVDDGQAGRVIAPVLQAPQALEQDRDGVPAADVADDSAHVIS